MSHPISEPLQLFIRTPQRAFRLTRSKKRSYRGDEDVRIDWFNQIAISTAIQPFHLVLSLNIGSRDMNDASRHVLRTLPDSPANFKSAHVRKVYIQQNQRRFVFGNKLESFFSGRRLPDRIAGLAQYSCSRISSGPVIVNVQDRIHQSLHLASGSTGIRGQDRPASSLLKQSRE